MCTIHQDVWTKMSDTGSYKPDFGLYRLHIVWGQQSILWSRVIDYAVSIAGVNRRARDVTKYAKAPQGTYLTITAWQGANIRQACL